MKSNQLFIKVPNLIICLLFIVFSLAACDGEKQNASNPAKASPSSSPPPSAIKSPPAVKIPLTFENEYEGNFEGGINFTLNLKSNSGDLSGTYYLHSDKVEQKVDGSLREDGSYFIRLFTAEGEILSRMAGVTPAIDKIEGTCLWGADKGKRAFKLVKI